MKVLRTFLRLMLSGRRIFRNQEQIRYKVLSISRRLLSVCSILMFIRRVYECILPFRNAFSNADALKKICCHQIPRRNSYYHSDVSLW